MGLISFLETPGRALAELIESLKKNLETKKSFELKTEEAEEEGRRILSITGIVLGDAGDPYDVKIEVPDNIYAGEIDSVLDWSDLSDKEKTKFKILEVRNKNNIFKNSDKDYIRVLQFINGINFSMDLSDEIELDTKIDKGFLYSKLYYDKGIPDTENEKQESLSRFLMEVDTEQDPDLIKNFYKKRKRILENKYDQLTQDLEQEERRIKEIADKAKSLRNKIRLSVIIVVATAIAAVAITAIVGGPIAGAIVFSSITKPIAQFLNKVVGFVTALVASHPVLVGIGLMGLFAAKKAHDGYKDAIRKSYEEDIKNKQTLQKKIKEKKETLDKEEKSLESVLRLSKTKDGEEYDLSLDGMAAVRMACDYLCYHLQGCQGKDPEDKKKAPYEYKASKLNITITDPDDAVEFFKKFPNKESNINKLRLQKITLCPSRIDIKNIQSMLQNNITILDITFIETAANELIKTSPNIISNLGIGNAIDKELIINRYLQSTTDANESLNDIIKRYGTENLSNIFCVDIKADDQDFKQNLLLNIRAAAENKLIQQADLSGIKIRQDMKYIFKLDKEFSEKVAFPMHLYYSPDSIKGSKNTGEFKQALSALVDIYPGLFKASINEHEREVLLKRLSQFIKDLDLKEKVNKSTSAADYSSAPLILDIINEQAKHKNVRRSIASFIAEKDVILKIVDNGLDQCRLFLNNFFDCPDDNPKAQEIKSCFDRKIKFMFELVKTKNVPDDKLEVIITDIFDNNKALVDIFYEIKNESKNSAEIEALFEANASDDDLSEREERDCRSFLKELRESSKKDNFKLVDSFMQQTLPRPKSKPKLRDNNKQDIFLNVFNKLNNKDKKDILKACIFRGKEAPSYKLGNLGEMLVDMLIEIMQSSEVVAAIAKTDSGLYSIFSALNSELNCDLKIMLKENNFYIFIRDFFIDKPKILSKDPEATKAIEVIQSIFNKINNDLSEQNSDLYREIQKSFTELKGSLANTKGASFLDGSKLKQEDEK